MTDNRDKKVIHVEVRHGSNESLYSLESIIDSQIAKLQHTLATEGDLDAKEFKKLESLVKMKESIMNMKNESKKESVLEGLTEEEIKAKAEAALKALEK